MKDEISELEKKIEAAETAGLGDSDKVKGYKAQLAKLKGAKTSAVVKESMIVLGVNEEELESSTESKYPKLGAHVSEFGLPYVKTAGISIAFPFTTLTEGIDEGKTGEIFGGMTKKSAWKTRDILKALDVEYTVNKEGLVAFDPADVAGKRGQVLWTPEPDKRPISEGGTGGTYPKATSVLPLGAELPEELLA